MVADRGEGPGLSVAWVRNPFRWSPCCGLFGAGRSILARPGGMVHRDGLRPPLRAVEIGPVRFGSGLVSLLLRDQATDTLGQKRTVERLLEGVVEPQREGLVTRFVAGQC